MPGIWLLHIIRRQPQVIPRVTLLNIVKPSPGKALMALEENPKLPSSCSFSSIRNWLQLREKSNGDTGGNDCRNQSKSQACNWLVPLKFERGMEIDFSDDGGKRKDGVFSSHGSALGVDAKSLVAISDRWVDIGGGAEGFMEDDSVDISGSNIVRGDSSGRLVREKDARSSTNIHFYNGESSRDQAYPSVQADPRIQHSFNSNRDEHGGIGTLSNSVPREGANKGSDSEDGMEFEDGGRVDALF